MEIKDLHSYIITFDNAVPKDILKNFQKICAESKKFDDARVIGKTAFKKRDMQIEGWFLNNFSENRIGPIPFECFFGFTTNLSSKNTFVGSSMYLGLLLNLQGW